MARVAALAVAGLAITFAVGMTGYFFGRNTANYDLEVSFQKEPAVTAAEASAQPDEPVLSININTASAEELERLDAIGPALAARIVEYRSAYGEFTYKAQIMDVPGIGESIFERIMDHITLN